MTDPTPVDDIFVVGQRRATPAGSYPPLGGGGSGGSGGLHQNEVGMEDPPLPMPTSHPCDDPETALEWNADAAAAEAKREFERLAAERGYEDFNSHEWYVFIYQNPDGTMYLGPVAEGSQNMVTPNTTGMTPVNLVGFVHNHPGGGLNPSGDDWTGFDTLYIGSPSGRLAVSIAQII